MLNYISAELYKVFHRKYLYIFTILILACEAFLVACFIFGTSNGNGMQFSDSLGVLTMLLPMGLYAAILVGDMVFSDQYKTGTLKNEISFGVPRPRVYLGKLATQCMVSVLLCAVIVLFYTAFNFLVLPHADAELTKTALNGTAWCLLSALPLWLGAQALVHMMYTVLKSSTMASLFTVGILAALGGVFYVLAALVNHDLFTTLTSVLLSTPFNSAAGSVNDWAFMMRSWAIGFCWFAGTTLIGIITFQKREIN